jgi:hypothetical protein
MRATYSGRRNSTTPRRRRPSPGSMAAKKTTLESLAKLISESSASADKKFAALAEDISDIKATMATKDDLAAVNKTLDEHTKSVSPRSKTTWASTRKSPPNRQNCRGPALPAAASPLQLRSPLPFSSTLSRNIITGLHRGRAPPALRTACTVSNVPFTE